jgi:glutamate dehydrogenase (NADP+)
VQNRTGDSWPLEEVNRRLDATMAAQFNVVHDMMERKGIDMRTAAYAVALTRIGEAITSLGTVRYFAGEDGEAAG